MERENALLSPSVQETSGDVRELRAKETDLLIPLAIIHRSEDN